LLLAKLILACLGIDLPGQEAILDASINSGHTLLFDGALKTGRGFGKEAANPRRSIELKHDTLIKLAIEKTVFVKVAILKTSFGNLTICNAVFFCKIAIDELAFFKCCPVEVGKRK
jgi:hypothetical protein